VLAVVSVLVPVVLAVVSVPVDVPVVVLVLAVVSVVVVLAVLGPQIIAELVGVICVVLVPVVVSCANTGPASASAPTATVERNFFIFPILRLNMFERAACEAAKTRSSGGPLEER
jgi:hypothetical protein